MWKLACFFNPAELTAHKLTPPNIALLDDNIREYDGHSQAATDRLARAMQAAESLARPNLEKLETGHRDLRRKVESALQAEGNLEARRRSCERYLRATRADIERVR